MADEDKEKAEKLAAAKKRFEQLKKEQAKKGKKGASKKKEDKAAAEKADEAESTTAVADDEDEEKAADDETTDDAARQSKQRSESFRQGTAPAANEVNELYMKQAARIEELEREGQAFQQQGEENAARLSKAEEELEKLRENSSDLADLRSKAKDAERVSAELAAVQRQLAQAQQAVKSGGSNRRVSGASADLSEELKSKTSMIEELELELSTVRNQLSGLQTTVLEREASVKESEERIQAAETQTASYKQELDALKVSIAFPSDETKAANEDPEALTKRITVLESDLRSANSTLDAAASRASSLEQKIEALTKLHRDVNTASQAKDKELADLRGQLRKRDRPSHVRDASEFELGEDETETGGLQARIRALEAENFDLRRGVWRDKRAELQPGMDDAARMGEYEDVDLSNTTTPYRGGGGFPTRQSSSFQDVLASGINAFTGRSAHAETAHGHVRNQSIGLLDEDEGELDEDAFRLAQEEEARRRIERVKEVKRGLEKWRGWRVDVAELRQQQGVGSGERGPVFEL